ncbi:MAG: alpha/beta hydrolase [Deltaproteobacteria bacterium]|nr:alpha/beta hydrolase [Deltaproteobacteria bacterium]MBW1875830.1 alpha/beta hydrolase [Deltaproteobacteria bacterium]MBW2210487.1 alpha/beta hydrolase [Deltaproteobacteria bacterium]MBW2626464.1 alpha/beta hydrolase [Deltaproteobacteria bacterium]
MVESRQIDGRTVTFRHEGGGGPALVCIHGSADNHHAYDRLLDALPNRDRYAINLPDRAGTEGPALGTVAQMETFLSRFIESEVEGDYLVVGHSLGGGVAIEHALASTSEHLKGIVLLATGARLRVHPMILQSFEQGAKTGELPPLPPGLYEQDVDPAIVEEAATARELTPIETGGTDWRAADGFDRMANAKDIQVPALIIAGTNDALTPPKYAEYLAATIPDNELHVIEGAGHMLVMERAAEVARRIESMGTR